MPMFDVLQFCCQVACKENRAEPVALRCASGFAEWFGGCSADKDHQAGVQEKQPMHTHLIRADYVAPHCQKSPPVYCVKCSAHIDTEHMVLPLVCQGLCAHPLLSPDHVLYPRRNPDHVGPKCGSTAGVILFRTFMESAFLMVYRRTIGQRLESGPRFASGAMMPTPIACEAFLLVSIAVLMMFAIKDDRSSAPYFKSSVLHPCHNLADKVALLTFCELSRIMHCVQVTIFYVSYAFTYFSLSLAFIVLTFTLAWMRTLMSHELYGAGLRDRCALFSDCEFTVPFKLCFNIKN